MGDMRVGVPPRMAWLALIRRWEASLPGHLMGKELAPGVSLCHQASEWSEAAVLMGHGPAVDGEQTSHCL